MVSAAGRTRRLPLPTAPGDAPRSAKLADLQTIIHLRMEETFGLIRARLQEQKLLSSLGGGVVLTGGGANLKNVTQPVSYTHLDVYKRQAPIRAMSHLSRHPVWTPQKLTGFINRARIQVISDP